jgi:hypothetical protein
MINLMIINYREICGCLTSNIIVCKGNNYSNFINNINFGYQKIILYPDDNIYLEISPYKCQHLNDLVIIKNNNNNLNDILIKYNDLNKYFKNNLCYKI